VTPSLLRALENDHGAAPRYGLRALADQAFSRAAGAPLVTGNRVDLLLDARENYPAWREAVAAAKRSVHVEMYIFHDDATGRDFARLFARKAREGVRVRILYDWLGVLGKTPARFWQDLRRAGVEVRSGNPPRLDDPLGWIHRDHRKLIVVDGEVAFVSGLCIGQDWVGWPERGIPPWRDTGIAIRGPAVADVAQAFAETWGAAGAPLPQREVPSRSSLAEAGDQALRVIASSPATTGMLRLDLLFAAIARRRLWLSDAYFVGTWAYLDALGSAARAGVDVRLLVPSASDVEIVAMLSRTQYRPLLEAGVRVFEWGGPMMHAKTAVVDGRWARVGSTNLNLASWLGNWELDVCVEDAEVARQMEDAFQADLDASTEIVPEPGHPPRPGEPRPAIPRRRRPAPGSAGRAAAAAIELGSVVGAAVAQRSLAHVESRSLALAGAILLALAVVALAWPRLLAVPAGIGLGWVALSLWVRAWRIAQVRSERRD
jgi:phosphatidylserine/phosphatidylglycerophosphate/cardiolipin synthase-like enzyme